MKNKILNNIKLNEGRNKWNKNPKKSNRRRNYFCLKVDKY
jgi:hypothetical protein